MMPPSSFSAKVAKYDAFRAPQADVEHVDAAVHQAALERGGELRAREADVVTDRDRAAA